VRQLTGLELTGLEVTVLELAGLTVCQLTGLKLTAFRLAGLRFTVRQLTGMRRLGLRLTGLRQRVSVAGGALGCFQRRVTVRLRGHASARRHPVIRRGQFLGDIGPGRSGRHNVTGHMRSSRPP